MDLKEFPLGGLTQVMVRSAFLFFCLIACGFGAERPNILWITSEDNSADWLGCYGNTQARSPELDKLASQGLRFTRAYANAPVCAVARSSILNGVHAVTQGTHHMRSRYPIPEDIIPYVTAMRSAGYYCTNRSKTDYNFKGRDTALWDDCSGKAHYRNRPQGQPFLAVMNLTISHESSLFAQNIAANRKRGDIPAMPRLDPAALKLPPYLPDLPEIRSDMAIYHDVVTALDREVGRILTELEREGLAEDTIVFYYSDHGGILPRAKRYLEDSGTRVPLLVRLPDKWRHLSPFAPGAPVDELVSFVDLAPTLLSLAGIKDIPPSMEGRPFLGALRKTPPRDDVVYLSADRFDEIPGGMRRGITDGRWKYIRNFSPHLPGAPLSNYQFGQAGWRAWRKAWQEGALEKRYQTVWIPPQPVELLFDLSRDPHEVRNLAEDPPSRTRLLAMRERLRAEMIRHRDAGLVPELMMAMISKEKPVSRYVKEYGDRFPSLVDLAFLSGAAKPSDVSDLRNHFGSADPLVRYWAAHAALSSPEVGESLLPDLRRLLKDPETSVRLTAARALLTTEWAGEVTTQLLGEVAACESDAHMLYVLDLLKQANALDQIPDEWITETIRSQDSIDPYPRRIAERLREERRKEGRKK